VPPEQLETLVQFFKALADATRLRILGLLAQQERSVEELASILALKEPTISHHLNKLKELSLVSMRAEGNVHWYSLNEAALHRMTREVLDPGAIPGLAADLSEDRYEQKVLQNFLVDGRLKEIPAQRKKRDVILRYLVGQFEPGVRYTEAQVNEVIKRYHEDFATLRREFIGGGLMARENGIYWRI
jgi:DNA-binding transcriptional ArsR family regulator